MGQQPIDLFAGASLLPLYSRYPVRKREVEAFVAVNASRKISQPSLSNSVLGAGGIQQLLDDQPNLRFQLEVAQRLGCRLLLHYRHATSNWLY